MEEDIPVIQIPEQMIRAAEVLRSDDANNVFSKILEASRQFKEAGMTPVYLYDMTTMNISLVVLETFGKRLH